MSATSDMIRIRGISLARPGSKLPRSVAEFRVEIVGMEIDNCVLIRTTNNGLTVRGPVGIGGDRCVRFVSPEIHNAVKQAARRVYLALGGEDLPEWAMREPVEVCSGDVVTETAHADASV